MSNPALAASVWRDVAEIAIELGPVDSWISGGGAEWGVAQWGVAQWGSQYLTPAAWLDVTADTLAFECDTGRNGVGDPGEVGTASLTLDDRAGAHGIAGAKTWVGALLRATALHVASGIERVIFLGKVVEDHADESLVSPAISIKALDILGSVLAVDDTTPLPAQSVRERLDELLDLAGFPIGNRDLDADTIALLPVDKAGSRIDAARGAAASSVGGTLYAEGDRVIYRHGSTALDPSAEPRFSIGTSSGAVCPTTLTLAEGIANILNVYDWANNLQDSPARATASDADSMHKYGRRASVRTDLLNAKADELGVLVRGELARTAYVDDAVDACTITLHDDPSAELVLVAIGDVCAFSYTGADPWASTQLVGSIAHHVGPDEWTLDLKCSAPEIGSLWGIGQWGISAWSSA